MDGSLAENLLVYHMAGPLFSLLFSFSISLAGMQHLKAECHPLGPVRPSSRLLRMPKINKELRKAESKLPPFRQ